MEPILSVQDLFVSYGPIQALSGISFDVFPGEIVSIVGANGAGKTTTLRTISGILAPSRGQIVFNGERIDGKPPHRIARMGISHVPEGRGIFYNLTVAENLEIAADVRRRVGDPKADLEHVFEIFPRLRERRKQKGGTLSGGEQQMLAIGRALLMGGDLLLLDEPSMGLAPNLVLMIFDVIRRLNREGKTILLVEQNAHKALSISHRFYIIKTGRISFVGKTSEEDIDEILREAYLT